MSRVPKFVAALKFSRAKLRYIGKSDKTNPLSVKLFLIARLCVTVERPVPGQVVGWN